jgi:hypothetical protein
MWYAKPSGAYAINSTEGTANILEINGILNGAYFTLEAQAGMIGNCYGESGLNPWRWQGDSVGYSKGYGLYQFTPARDYFNNCYDQPGYAPNTSTSSIVSGANPEDGFCQTYVVINDILNKWVGTCWRSYWSKTEYATLYQQSRNIISTYGSNDRLSLLEFRNINNIGDATLAFLACYEGPAVPNYNTRLGFANQVYSIISGDTPPPPIPPIPPGPTPTPIPRGKLPVWMMIKRIH